MLQDFTTDTLKLQQAINSIALGYPSTNLYGSIITALSRWTDQFTLNQLTQGSLIVFTDGNDTQGSSTLNAVVTARGSKKIYMIGLGNEISPEVLNQISYPSTYISISKANELEETFNQIQADIVRYSNSFYWLNYMSPKRSGTHTLAVSTSGNTNLSATGTASGSFSAEGFQSVNSGVYVNISDTKLYGVDSVFCFYNGASYNFTSSRYGAVVSKDSLVLKPTSYWAFKQPEYNWVIGNTPYLKLENANYSTMVLKGAGGDTISTTLNVQDQANGYTKQVNVEMIPENPLFRISSPIDITDKTVTFEGAILSEGRLPVLSKGFVWNTSTNPTVSLSTKTNSGKGKGSISASVSNLKTGTKYYVRLYASNSSATIYSTTEAFTTSIGLPELTTKSISNITSTTASSGGTITHDGGSAVTARGVCWSTSPTPTINDSISRDGTGSGNFNSVLSGLKGGATYYVRAYATNSVGTAYGTSLTFKTLKSAPKLTTSVVGSITATTAICGGNIAHDGGASVTIRGLCWSTSPSPTINNNKTTDGSGIGSFTSSITGLRSATLYYIRSYATNSIGTAYGDELSFTTSIGLPELTTTAISNITFATASSGGIITHNGGAAVTARGVVWSTSQNPTISLSTKTSDETGTGAFTSSITGHTVNTTYYVRAYATNSIGTAYGIEVNFSLIGTVTSATGKVWMDRNLGASHVATSRTDSQGYGDLYQWGRRTDGHEKRTSQTIYTLSSGNTPGHGNFITVSSVNYDWRSPQNNNLWQGVNATNNPCPAGFRIPTSAEWNAERESWSSNTSTGAFASPLKLPVAGYRGSSDGSLYSVGSTGDYWSDTVNGTNAQHLYFYSSGAGMSSYYRAFGYSVRCIKD